MEAPQSSSWTDLKKPFNIQLNRSINEYIILAFTFENNCEGNQWEECFFSSVEILCKNTSQK